MRSEELVDAYKMESERAADSERVFSRQIVTSITKHCSILKMGLRISEITDIKAHHKHSMRFFASIKRHAPSDDLPHDGLFFRTTPGRGLQYRPSAQV